MRSQRELKWGARVYKRMNKIRKAKKKKGKNEEKEREKEEE